MIAFIRLKDADKKVVLLVDSVEQIRGVGSEVLAGYQSVETSSQKGSKRHVSKCFLRYFLLSLYYCKFAGHINFNVIMERYFDS